VEASCQLIPQGREGRIVGPRARANHKVDTSLGKQRKNIAPCDFPKTSLQAIPLHNGMPVLRDNDADPWMTQKGSEDPNLEVFGSSSLPFTQNPLQIRSPRQPKPTGIGSALRRRRTWSAAGR
jgi:hypothetical protein